MNILILGENSYIGTSFFSYIGEVYPDWHAERLSVRGDAWKNKDFSRFEVVLYVAGIAHIKENRKNQNLYYKVNRDLAVDTALKAKAEGIKHFVYISSMSVYGMDMGVITKDTPANPKTAYGKSKLQAEETLAELSETGKFEVTLVRPPMVYGEGCKGNYQLLKRLALFMPIFPDFKNSRSMISIDKLCDTLAQIIREDRKASVKTVLPQNDEYVCTSQMVVSIAKENGKKVRLVKGFTPLIKVGMKISSRFRKVFGTLVYER